LSACRCAQENPSAETPVVDNENNIVLYADGFEPCILVTLRVSQPVGRALCGAGMPHPNQIRREATAQWKQMAERYCAKGTKAYERRAGRQSVRRFRRPHKLLGCRALAHTSGKKGLLLKCRKSSPLNLLCLLDDWMRPVRHPLQPFCSPSSANGTRIGHCCG